MNLKHHFRFPILDPKQLTIALTSSFSTWAAVGFQRDSQHLGYVLVGFITGGLISHNSTSSPNVQPDSHIVTPYSNNIDDKSESIPPLISPVPKLSSPITETTAVKINSAS